MLTLTFWMGVTCKSAKKIDDHIDICVAIRPRLTADRSKLQSRSHQRVISVCARRKQKSCTRSHHHGSVASIQQEQQQQARGPSCSGSSTSSGSSGSTASSSSGRWQAEEEDLLRVPRHQGARRFRTQRARRHPSSTTNIPSLHQTTQHAHRGSATSASRCGVSFEEGGGSASDDLMRAMCVALPQIAADHLQPTPSRQPPRPHTNTHKTHTMTHTQARSTPTARRSSRRTKSACGWKGSTSDARANTRR